MASGDSTIRLSISSDVITCSVCFDHFVDPKALPCGHSLCRSPCLERLSRDLPMYCPLCRMKIDMPPSGRIDDLPTNYVVKDLLEMGNQSEEEKATEPDEEPVSWIGISSGTCQAHEEDCDFFCITCTAIVCAKCLLSSHKVGHHGIIAAAEYAREKIDELIKTLEEVRKLDLGRYYDQRFSVKILERMGRYYQKMPEFKESLQRVSSQRDELEKLCSSLVEDLCQSDFGRVKEVKGIPQRVNKMHKEHLKLDNLYSDICRDLQRLKKVGLFAAAAAVGLSFGIPLIPL